MTKFRGEMSGIDRAKQFAPFAALKGHEMELAKYQEIVEPRRQLAEDEALVLSETLSSLAKGDCVKVVHYLDNIYQTTFGIIEKIYEFEREIQIKGMKIKFIDIYRIEKTGL